MNRIKSKGFTQHHFYNNSISGFIGEIRKSGAGFTLIETLLYSILISFIIGGALVATYGLLEGSGDLNDRVVTEEEANFLLKKIEWGLINNDSIITPLPGTTSGTLTTVKLGSADTYTFDLSSGNLRLTRGPIPPNSPVILNTERTVVNDADFEHIASIGTKPPVIKTTLVINGKTYNMTTYMRN